MHSLSDNDAFWRARDLHVAVNPHQPAAANGLAEFAAAHDGVSGLLFFQTSGSEGAPKWVGQSREAFLESAGAVNAHLEAASRDRWLIALPLHHVGGFSILARCRASGASFAQLDGKWSAQHFAQACAREKSTLASLVPAQVYDLVRGKLPAPDCLRAVVVGGGGLSRELGAQAHELGWRVLQSYGMTETASQIATEPLDHLYSGFDPDRLEVLRCWRLETDADQRLSVRGAALAEGFATRRADAWHWERIDPDAGLRTRDFVRLWDHGTRKFLQFVGRESSIVKVLGELVNLDALQQRLNDLLAVMGLPPGVAVVWPASHERSGTQLMLAGAMPPAQLEELQKRFNATVPGCEHLGPIRQVARIPRTALGKLDRAAMQDLMTR